MPRNWQHRSRSDIFAVTQLRAIRSKPCANISAEDFHSPESLRCTSCNGVLEVPKVARREEAPLIEAIDSVGDFLRFVDQSNKSEISSRGWDNAVRKRTSDAPNHTSTWIALIMGSFVGLGD